MNPPVTPLEDLLVTTVTGDEVRVQQYTSALSLANHVRRARAQAKRDLRNGHITLLDAMALECVQTMRLDQMLMAQHRWGYARMVKACAAVGITSGRLIGQVTPRQRLALARTCSTTDPNTPTNPMEATAA